MTFYLFLQAYYTHAAIENIKLLGKQLKLME